MSCLQFPVALKSGITGFAASPLDAVQSVHDRTCRRLKENLVENPNWVRVGSDGFHVKLQNGSSGTTSYGVTSKTKSPLKWFSYGGCIPSILRALEAVRDLDEALKPWEESLSNKERSIILNEQLDWERALEIFEWFKKKGCYELNVIHYNIMLRILGMAKRWDLVGSLWCEMQSKGIAPTNSTYGTLIDTYSKGGHKKEALLWLGDMYKQGLEPDEVTTGIVVQAYKKAGEFGEAQQFFKRWLCSTNDPSLTQKCLSMYTYNTLIDIYGKAGQLKEASDTFAQMLKEGIVPNTVTFNTMIHICGNHGHLEEVASLMEKMEELRCFPDTRTYNILISLYTKANDINAATGYFLKMKESGLVPDIVSYRTLLYAFSIRHMVGEAEVLVLEMEERGLDMDEFTQSALTRMYIDAGMLVQSWSWFQKFKYKMSSECYAANIDAFGERGHLFLAEKAFSCCLARQKFSVLVFNVMIKAYGIDRDCDKVCEIFDSMGMYGISPDKCTYNTVIQILSGAELPQKAKSYLRKMQEAGFVDDCVPYCSVISSFAKIGELGMMEDLFKEMIEFKVQPDIVVFGTLINAFAEAGRVQEAKKYIDSMESAGFTANSIICNSLIKLYTKVGYLQEAQETYQLVQSLNEGPDVYASNCMIDLYSEHAMVKETEIIFESLKRRGEANEFSFSMMVHMYRKVGQFGKAFGIAQEMRDMGLLTDALSYNTLIGLYTSDGRMKEVTDIFLQMLNFDIQPNDATFELLGNGLIKRGASKGAINHLELARKKNARSGLHAWIEAVCSMVGVDYDASDLGCKVRGVLKVDSAPENFVFR